MFKIKLCEAENQSGEVIYSSPEDLLNLLRYMFRFDKTYMDSVRNRNVGFNGPYCGCEGFYFSKEYEKEPEMIYSFMMFTIHSFIRSKEVSFVKHRIISFDASSYLLPQDLDHLGRQIAHFYASYGHTAAYAVHADSNHVHIHIAVNNISYMNGNLLHISFEYNKLWNICKAYENRLLEDSHFLEKRECILFGKPRYTANVGLSAEEQIRVCSEAR